MAFLPSWLGGGGTTVDSGGQVVPLGGGLGMNSLIGLGLGLMSGTRNDPYGNAMGGFAAGSRADMDAEYRAQLLADRKAERARQAERDKILDARDERDYKLREQQFKESLNVKPSIHWSEQEDPTTGAKSSTPYLVSPNGTYRPLTLQQADQLSQQVPTAPPAMPTFTMPDGSVQTMPVGANRKKWQEEMTKIAADAQGGKQTEEQAKSSQFAARMENAERNLGGGLDQQGLSLKGKAAEGSSRLPGSQTLGNYFQSDEYQKYGTAKSQFITALLRRESGAAIAPYEFDRYDREFFPQPGDTKDQVDGKREARRVAIEQMKKSGGPAYRSPEAPRTDLKKKYGLE